MCPTDVQGVIDILAWKACDHSGRRMFVSVTTKERNLVTNVRQYAILRQTRYGSSGVPLKRDAFAADTDVHTNPWTARARAVITQMVRYLERSEQIQVAISSLEHFLPGTDADISIRSLVNNAQNKEITADSFCSTRLEVKEGVEELGC